MSRHLAVLAALTLATGIAVLTAGMGNPDPDERKAVERAVLDYCEAFYEMKPELLERSLHPELNKFGFFRHSADQPYQKVDSSFAELVELAKVWNRDGKFGKDALKKVEVYEVLDQIAAAKLVGAWGIDYVHLAKYDGKWRIVQVLWQSHPESDSKRPAELR